MIPDFDVTALTAYLTALIGTLAASPFVGIAASYVQRAINARFRTKRQRKAVAVVLAALGSVAVVTYAVLTGAIVWAIAPVVGALVIAYPIVWTAGKLTHKATGK